jgi:hypothetical protein
MTSDKEAPHRAPMAPSPTVHRVQKEKAFVAKRCSARPASPVPAAHRRRCQELRYPHPKSRSPFPTGRQHRIRPRRGNVRRLLAPHRVWTIETFTLNRQIAMQPAGSPVPRVVDASSELSALPQDDNIPDRQNVPSIELPKEPSPISEHLAPPPQPFDSATLSGAAQSWLQPPFRRVSALPNRRSGPRQTASAQSAPPGRKHSGAAV